MKRLKQTWKQLNALLQPTDNGTAKSRAQLAAKSEISRTASLRIRMSGWLFCAVPVAWVCDRIIAHAGLGKHPNVVFGVGLAGGIIIGELIRFVYIRRR